MRMVEDERHVTDHKLRAYLLKTHPKESDKGDENESLNNWSIF